jgi:hypothetical protein
MMAETRKYRLKWPSRIARVVHGEAAAAALDLVANWPLGDIDPLHQGQRRLAIHGDDPVAVPEAGRAGRLVHGENAVVRREEEARIGPIELGDKGDHHAQDGRRAEDDHEDHSGVASEHGRLHGRAIVQRCQGARAPGEPYCARAPPSITSSLPVTYDESSDAR